MLPLLRKQGVKITAKPSEGQPWYMTFLLSWLPMLLFLGIWIFFMRQMQGAAPRHSRSARVERACCRTSRTR